MKVSLDQKNIIRGVELYLRDIGIPVDNYDITVTFTMGRKIPKLYADVELTPKAVNMEPVMVMEPEVREILNEVDKNTYEEKEVEMAVQAMEEKESEQVQSLFD